MSPTCNAAIIFKETLETGYPEPGRTTVYDTSRTIDLENVSLDGGVLVKLLYLSNDPYLRTRMGPPESGKWANPVFSVGEPIANFGVGRILRSENSDYTPGYHVSGYFNFEEYIVLTAATIPHSMFQKIDNKAGIPWSAYLGAAGMPGQTAYYGYKEYLRVKKGQTIWISTGAGAVGSVLIQLAKRDGLRVIASAGSDEKVSFMKEIGADVAFNYKTTNTGNLLAKEGPIDIYWDCVGQASLDYALENINKYGQIIIAGSISGYNSGHTYAYKNIYNIDKRTLRVHGFGIMDPELAEHWSESFFREIPSLIASGELKYREERTPFAQAGEAFLRIQKGENFGKSVLVVADE
ncbi:NAD-P-binding protein [Cylindrobasidium torrendii FP15055 ss-10]|uniref:NAD-P-binding protein n=1 Tax=Cylindrobasidium torrendii FP15055 ss-10 TaxID=1314674 RepID=A0A0D7BHB3_9AGAR|nr:NAD-P-binding protein [Cylindrobasidium torrendii FP15055 ss-10]